MQGTLSGTSKVTHKQFELTNKNVSFSTVFCEILEVANIQHHFKAGRYQCPVAH